MKKTFCFFIANILMIFFSLTVFAETEYKDPITDVMCNIPDGWHETQLTKDREIIKKKYLPQVEDGASIQFGYGDLWSELPENEKSNYKRSDFNHKAIMDTFSENEIKEILGISNQNENYETVKYGNRDYIKITIDTNISVGSISENISMIYLIHFDNGYFFQFIYGDLSTQSHFKEFENMMYSVRYSQTSIASNSVIGIDEVGDIEINWLNLIISVVITITVYSLPIIIYRYLILKNPIPESKAKKITIIYGIIAFFIMAFLIGGAPGGAIILWSFINHKILVTPTNKDIGLKYTVKSNFNDKNININNTDKDLSIIENTKDIFNEYESQILTELDLNEPITIEKENNIIEIEETNIKKEVLFCRKCGNKLPTDAVFCHKCGTKVIND